MEGLSIMSMVMAVVLSGMPQERVLYVPGWHRCGRGEDEAFRSVQAAFPDARVEVHDWAGNASWRTARKNADHEAELLAAELAALPEEERDRLVVVGHSLGGRIVVRALSRLNDRGCKVKQGVVLAAALPCDDESIGGFAAASRAPAVIVRNPRDTMLKYAYRPFGGERAHALGAAGPAAPIANCQVVTVDPATVGETPLDALWAKIGWFRTAAAHYAPFYLERLRKHQDQVLRKRLKRVPPTRSI